MDKRKRDSLLVALIIHGFTIAHAVVAGFLGPAAGAVLTPMTTAMVVAIGWLCGAKASVALALKHMSLFLAYLLGVGIAEVLIGFIPVFGNFANATASAIVTELVGWATYIIYRDSLDKNDEIDLKELLEKANKEREEHSEFMDQLRKAMKKMSFRDKAKYRRYMKIVRKKNVSDSLRQEAFLNAKLLMEQYGVEFE